MKEYSIRQFQAGDLGAIQDLSRRAWVGYTTSELLEERHGLIDGRPWQDRFCDDLVKHLSREDVRTFVAEVGGKVAGFAAAQIEPGGKSEVGIVSYNAVDPAHQKRGIGTALIQRVLDFLEEQGARILLVWTLEADEPACRLYDRLGFEELTRFVYYSLERHGESEEKA